MFKLIIQSLMIFIVFSIIGCSDKKLYSMAINYERSRANLEVKSVKLDFGDIVYLENNINSDTAIVLLHGFGGDKDNWNRFSAELENNNRILVLDLPGHGESISGKKLDYSITHQAQMLNKFLVAKNINKIHIAGNSMGGAIALRFTDLYSTKVKTLTLIDAMGTSNSKNDLEVLSEKEGSNPLLNVCTEAKFDKLMQTGMQEPPYIPGILKDLVVSKKCARADIEKIIYNNMLTEADLSKVSKNIKTPTLIIWGEKDRVFSVDNAKLFHNDIQGSKLVILENSGHVPLLEAPKKTAQVFTNFIRNN
ncbi:MAG: alpha/beta fold hydrolase [Thiohalomonadales bacterium]